MKFSDLVNELVYELASDFAWREGYKYAPLPRHYQKAQDTIDQMSNYDLLLALAEAEDSQ